jgi:hypothetical protein
MLEWIGYILARTIAGVLVALIVAMLLKNKRYGNTAGAITTAL